ncbi:MAG: arginine--tRNA ligase, partial [Clostridia bacterium]|nr:arginine--tRNA ligase [Clostridia bacterium]
MNFKTEIAKLISSAELPYEEVLSLLMPPKDIAMGDICMPCFKFAKALRLSPVAIAEKIASTLTLPPFVSECTAVAGYLNFKYDNDYFARSVLEKVKDAGSLYGSSEKGSGKTVCIDYSSVNIAKPFHIGHLPSTAIGNSLSRIYNHLGYRAVGINH